MRITSFGQSVSIDNMSAVQHHITVLLDSGKEATVPVLEETVEILMHLKAGGGSLVNAPRQIAPEYPTRAAGVIFTGQELAVAQPIPMGFNQDPGELRPLEPVMGVVAEMASPGTAKPGGIGQPKSTTGLAGHRIPAGSKTVQTNEIGYPIPPKKHPSLGNIPKPVMRRDDDGVQI